MARSFREFTIQQIAGDMLPQPATDQLIASGFNRNTMTNMEGGVDPEEYYWYTQVDRVNTTATVWLGSTLACAEWPMESNRKKPRSAVDRIWA